MAISIISTEFFTNTGTITIPSGCTMVVYGGGTNSQTPTINGTPMTLLVTQNNQPRICQMINPPIGSYSVTLVNGAYHTFIYLSGAGSGVNRTVADFAGGWSQPTKYGSIATAPGELAIFDAGINLNMSYVIDNATPDYIGGGLCSKKVATGNSISYGLVINGGQIDFVGVSFPVSGAAVDNTTYTCLVT